MKPNNKKIKVCTEITLRDYFAAAALQGMCANPDISESAYLNKVSQTRLRISFAESAYKMADEMLRESNSASNLS